MKPISHARLARLVVASAVFVGAADQCAFAEPSEAEKRSEAEAIFAEAKDLMTKKDFAHACPKLEEVVRLQPVGIGAKITLADCYLGAGKLASAHAMLGEAASLAAQANQTERATAAQGRAQELEPKLSKLTITIPNAIANTPGLSIVRDGSQVTQALYNVTVPVDGGTHTIVATAPHMKPFETKLEVPSESGSVTVNVVLIPEAPQGISSSSGGAVGAPQLGNAQLNGANPSTLANANSSDSTTFWSPVRIGGAVVAGVGVAVVGVGIGIGASGVAKTAPAASAFSAAKARGDIAGENQALQDHADAHNQAVGGWVTAGIGGAAAIAGVVMIAAGPRGPKSGWNARITVVPTFVETSRGVAVLGEF